MKEAVMSATAHLRLVAPTATRAPAPPESQILNVTIENDEKLLLTIVEAAHRLGIGRTLMYELLGSGQVESVHVGRLHRVPAVALARFVERRTAVESPQDAMQAAIPSPTGA
jgi:excisionase family DNA binding protein